MKALPKYRSHKVVEAVLIASIANLGRIPDDDSQITPADKSVAPFNVSAAYVEKHKPVAGGYYVRYEDGYESFSPAAAFEAGYSPLDAEPQPNSQTDSVQPPASAPESVPTPADATPAPTGDEALG